MTGRRPLRYKESSRTLTVQASIAVTTSRTRHSMAELGNSVRLDETMAATQHDVAVNKDTPYILPLNGVQRVLSVSAPQRVLILHRSALEDEFTLFSVCSGTFVLVGSILGQIAIQGDYAESTRCNLFYS